MPKVKIYRVLKMCSYWPKDARLYHCDLIVNTDGKPPHVRRCIYLLLRLKTSLTPNITTSQNGTVFEISKSDRSTIQVSFSVV